MILRIGLLLAALMILATCSGGDSDGPGGQVCTRGVIGERIASIPGKLPGCAVRNPVKVYSVQGIKLSRPAIMDCTTAKALNKWTRQSVKPSFAKEGARVSTMVVYDDYNCRTRNNRPGAKLSFHAKGRAVDIGEFILADGRRVTVLKDWRSTEWGATLQKLHKAACGPFRTVLGPNHDRLHANHFHLDTASGYGGLYCR